jgi:hypothetical protein
MPPIRAPECQGRSTAIAALVKELFGAVRPVALEPVNAFGRPGAAGEVAMVVPSQHE